MPAAQGPVVPEVGTETLVRGAPVQPWQLVCPSPCSPSPSCSPGSSPCLPISVGRGGGLVQRKQPIRFLLLGLLPQSTALAAHGSAGLKPKTHRVLVGWLLLGAGMGDLLQAALPASGGPGFLGYASIAPVSDSTLTWPLPLCVFTSPSLCLTSRFPLFIKDISLPGIGPTLIFT